MAINSRNSSGIPSRQGGGGGGGGSITVNDHTGKAISTGVRTIEWQTDGLGFAATIDPTDPTKVIIGDPPVFLGPVTWTNHATTSVRVAESDPLESDSFPNLGWEGTVHTATKTSNIVWISTIGRGLGDNSLLKVKAFKDDVLLAEHSIVCNSAQTDADPETGIISLQVSGYSPDGDGSAYSGRVGWTFNVVGDGNNASGKIRIEASFLEHKWGVTRTFSEEFFYESTNSKPSLSGVADLQIGATADQVHKYLSGIRYFTTGSSFPISLTGIDDHNNDSSRPSDSLIMDTSSLGVSDFNTSPWGSDAPKWSNVTELDTVQNLGYTNPALTINMPNFRHVGPTTVKSNVRDRWGSSTMQAYNQYNVFIDTHSRASTATTEYFDEENMRLNRDYTTGWDSTAELESGDGAFFGGHLMQASDIPLIQENSQKALDSLGDPVTYYPDRNALDNLSPNPDYRGDVRDGVFFRSFPASGEHSGGSVTIDTNMGNLEAGLKAGSIKVFMWKYGSVNAGTPNIILPPTYDHLDHEASKANSIWLHGNSPFNFGTFEDGGTQTNSAATCRTSVSGNTVNFSFGGNDSTLGLLMRIEVEKGNTINQIDVSQG